MNASGFTFLTIPFKNIQKNQLTPLRPFRLYDPRRIICEICFDIGRHITLIKNINQRCKCRASA